MHVRIAAFVHIGMLVGPGLPPLTVSTVSAILTKLGNAYGHHSS